MSRKIPIMDFWNYDDDQVVGEVEICDDDKVVVTFTDPRVVRNFTEADESLFTIPRIGDVLDLFDV